VEKGTEIALSKTSQCGTVVLLELRAIWVSINYCSFVQDNGLIKTWDHSSSKGCKNKLF
jgi:hypothetical protein